ncbi:hypothetical protein RV11_GL001210 [Enterococcus phoeniculicola]|jgi:hypothetical protein|uniref:Lipoprotein n=1 Tax=Enterococcus phoeniculicola ATCC BAA-412 TaxID=1158610 RepID=R3TWU8_9ENTE|nr:hypothetical protein [Enterococcus phoeniculicola]EOL46064.1 hypothetical protein UC3_00869 [Enterococcus phoeniculicola ATCC BAA-412]EOT77091.1 hypothetical protein I589_02053 [Enterococcus phoeniculicola ATCC BAA-412]OJG73430.1 hypothetical protein RV11_GL001210 [Enterococcus phoeniculicola]
MKKLIIWTMIAGSAGILLAGCSKNNTKPNTTVSTTELSKESSGKKMTETTSETPQTRSEFTAVLSDDATENKDTQKTIRLALDEVAAVKDPETILPMMQNDGVILNVTKEQLSKDSDLTTLKKGTKITFILTGLPVMTMSIPPQIPGNSVEQVIVDAF